MIIGTRGSLLALSQTRRVSKLLKLHGFDTLEKIIKTKGDIITNKPIHLVSSGFGAFVKELDESLENEEIDLAVHSMKDLPSERPQNLNISAVLERDRSYDLIISTEGLKLDDFQTNSIIGTSSLRRKAQLLRYRNDFIVKELRGNIETRLKKLNDGSYDGIILSEAGLQRLGMTKIIEHKSRRLDIDKFCPSPNQGTIAIVTLNNTRFNKIVSLINDPTTFIETFIERTIMKSLNVGCIMPVGIFAKHLQNCKSIKITIDILNLDGTNSIKFNEIISCKNMKYELDILINKIFSSKALDIINEIHNKIKFK